jgi:hypothetical protein
LLLQIYVIGKIADAAAIIYNGGVCSLLKLKPMFLQSAWGSHYNYHFIVNYFLCSLGSFGCGSSITHILDSILLLLLLLLWPSGCSYLQEY